MSSKRLVAPPQVSSGLIYWLSKALLYTCNKVWLRLAVEGAHHVPRTGPVLIVANHASYLDPPVLGCATRRVVQFLAQSGLAKRGLLRWWLQKVGVVLIDRKAPSKDALRFCPKPLHRAAVSDCSPKAPAALTAASGRSVRASIFWCAALGQR